YTWKNSTFEAPAMGSLVVYETLLRDFLAAHDWKTLTDTLGYFQRLGVSAIELMPFSEFEGNESWGYNPSFYFAPDKYYGPKNDLKRFIDSCHSRGIAVIQDMVLNHSMGQSPLAILYWDNANNRPAADNPWYNATSPNTAYSWGSDFNHESAATKAFVSRVVSYWLDEYKVDGFRFDFTKGFTNTVGDGWAYDASRISILKRIADTIWQHNPQAYVILEHFTDNAEETVLTNYGMAVWGNLNYAYGQASMGFNSGWDLTWISYKYRGFNNPNLVGYMESHDEERQMYRNLNWGNSSGDYNIRDLATALSRVELTSTFFIPIPGPKMIWQFGEMGYDYSIDYNDRVGNKPIRWDYLDVMSRERLFLTFAALNKLKTTEPAFSSTEYFTDLANKVKLISINDEDMDVRIVGNFDVVSNTGVVNFSRTGTWYDYFSGEMMNVSQTNTTFTLAPGEYHIFTTKALETPDRPNSIRPVNAGQESLLVYPNPASDLLMVETGGKEGSLCLFNMNGQKVLEQMARDFSGQLRIGSLSPGAYLLIFTDRDGGRSFARVMKQ
ncbi:MAG: alpha-amylase family glycosyl hydrolase, partial [Bacteroidota bacterium]